VNRQIIARTLIVTLAACSAALAAARNPDSASAPIQVVLRTRDDIFVGRDLRYSNGAFRLKQAAGDATVAEGDLAQVTFVRETGDWSPEEHGKAPKDPVLRPVLRAVVAARAERWTRWTGKMERPRPWASQNTFYLPGEMAAETFPKLAPRVTDPDLTALLCEETVALCLRQDTPEAAATLFTKAEEQAKGRRNDLAFVYGLMHAAILAQPNDRAETARRIKQLAVTYPEMKQRVEEYIEAMGSLRPMGLRGLRPPGGAPEGRPEGPPGPRNTP